VASAEPYASLHLAPERQPCQHPTAHFFTGRMPFLPLTIKVQITTTQMLFQIPNKQFYSSSRQQILCICITSKFNISEFTAHLLMRQSIVWCRVTVQWFLQWQWHTAAGMLQQTPTSAAISNALARHTVPQKNDTDVACYSFNICRAILTTFGRNVVERVRYQKVVYLPTSANYWLYTTWGNTNPRNCVRLHMLYQRRAKV